MLLALLCLHQYLSHCGWQLRRDAENQRHECHSYPSFPYRLVFFFLSSFSRLGVSLYFSFLSLLFRVVVILYRTVSTFFVFDACLTHNAKELQYYPIPMKILCNVFAVFAI